MVRFQCSVCENEEEEEEKDSQSVVDSQWTKAFFYTEEPYHIVAAKHRKLYSARTQKVQLTKQCRKQKHKNYTSNLVRKNKIFLSFSIASEWNWHALSQISTSSNSTEIELGFKVRSQWSICENLVRMNTIFLSFIRMELTCPFSNLNLFTFHKIWARVLGLGSIGGASVRMKRRKKKSTAKL